MESNQIGVIPFHYYVNGADNICTDTKGFDGVTFYNAMREGATVTTSQISPQHYIDFMRPILASGEDILFVGMSSGISGSYASAQTAAAQLCEEFPERKICLVDTLGASLGEGILVLKAVADKLLGLDLDEIYEKLMSLRHRICQVFTVDDLKYLRKGGRLSNMAFIVGTILHIKPLLKGNEEGKIVAFEKIRGRKKAIEALAAHYDAHVVEPEDQTVCIAHADCPEDANRLIDLLKRNHPPKQILSVCYEPVTGSHVGPGTLALFFTSHEGIRAV